MEQMWMRMIKPQEWRLRGTGKIGGAEISRTHHRPFRNRHTHTWSTNPSREKLAFTINGFGTVEHSSLK